MFDEDELLPISALQHLIFCPRQCALIHIERLWAENRLTVEGKHLHERADTPTHQTRDGVRAVRSLPIRSVSLGLTGIADVVEFAGQSATPIEYKRGRPKKDDCDRVQLCAQAICLEEMTGQTIDAGALFYGKRKRRTEVVFDASLRSTTKAIAQQLHEMISQRKTPLATYQPKCDSCSLINLCLPKATNDNRSASRFMARQLATHYRNEDGPKSDSPNPQGHNA